jgi:O-antigen ligase
MCGSRRRKAIRVCAAAGILLQIGAIAATRSRVFLIALPASAIVFILLRAPLARWIAAAAATVAVLVFFSPARPLGVTIQGRLYPVRVTADYWRQIPLTGYGPGAFAPKFAEWQVSWLPRHGREDSARFAGIFDHAHNDYIEFWIEYGPVGFLAIWAMCGRLAYGAWSRRKVGAPAWSADVCAGLAVLMAVATVDFPFHRPAEWALFWLLLGMITAGNSFSKGDVECISN